MSRPRVLLVEVNPLFLCRGRLWAPKKSLANFALFALDIEEAGADLIIGSQEIRESVPEDLPVDYSLVQDFLSEEHFLPRPLTEDEVRSLDPSIIWMLNIRRTGWLSRLGIPTYLTMEVPVSVRIDLARSSGGSVLDHLRSTAGLLRDELQMRRRIRRSAGVEFNGVAARDAYARLNPAHFTFYDHRIHQRDLDALGPTVGEPGIPKRTNTPAVAFSGRLMHIKGAHLLPQIAEGLQRLCPEARFHVLGGGELLEEVRSVAPSNMVIHGFMDMEAWKEFVREHVGVLVFPHLQGDPSGTYFEAMGCGAAVVGFDNVTLTPLTQGFGVGWTVPKGDVEGLATLLSDLLHDGPRLLSAQRKAREFMADRSLEKTAAMRVDQLLQACPTSSRNRTA